MEKGEKFISNIEQKRIDVETKYEQMYEGVYTHTINYIANNNGNLGALKVPPLVPLPSVISDINADLLFGEFPFLKFTNEVSQDTMELWLKDTTFKTDTLEASTYTSVLGTIFIYSYEYDGKTYYKYIKSNNVIWDEDDFGLTDVKVFDVKDSDKTYIYYKVQEHTFSYDTSIPSPYLDDNRKHILSNYTIKVKKSDGKIEDIIDYKPSTTENNFLPIIKICNTKLMNHKTGKSDYSGKCQLFAEIDNRLDQLNYVIQQHSEPWTAVPAGLLDQNGKLDSNFGKMYEKMGGSGSSDDISVKTWDGHLADAFTAINTMIKMILFTSRISSPIAGFFDNTGGNIESGRALKWRSISTNSMIMRKRKYWEDALREFFKQQSEMGGELKDIDFNELIFEWQDGLPMDDEALTESVIAQVGAGLMSKLEGTQKVQEVDEDDAQAEQNQIDSEKQEDANIQSTKFRVEI